MEIDDYQEESKLIDINNINPRQSSSKKKNSFRKTLETKGNTHFINQSNYESLFKNFEEKLLKIFSQKNENSKMLKITIEEETLDFEEIEITAETKILPAFKNFKCLTEMLKKFFAAESKKNFFQLFINVIDLLNFFCRDLFHKQTFNYFSFNQQHLVQPKIKEFVQEKLLEKDMTKEISVFYSLTEKINFGLSEEFLLFSINEKNNFSNQACFACYAHFIRVFLGLLLTKLHAHVNFVVESFESLIFEEETQRYDYQRKLKKCEKLLDLVLKPNWDKVRKVNGNLVSAFGNEIGFERHFYFNKKGIFCGEKIEVHASNSEFDKKRKGLFLENCANVKIEAGNSNDDIDDDDNENDDLKFNSKRTFGKTGLLIKCDYQIISWAEFLCLLSYNVKKLKKKCKMEKEILEIITLIAIKTFIDSYFNSQNLEEDSIYCIPNISREETLKKLRLIFYDYLNDLDIESDLVQWKVYYVMNIFSSNDYLNHFFESLVHQCALEILRNKMAKLVSEIDDLTKGFKFDSDNYNFDKVLKSCFSDASKKNKLLNKIQKLIEFLNKYQWNPKNYFAQKRKNRIADDYDDLRRSVLQQMGMLKSIAKVLQNK